MQRVSMMNIVILTVTFLMCIISFYIFFSDLKKHPLSGGEKIEESQISRSAWIYGGLMCCLTMGAAVLFCTLYKDNDLFLTLKRMGLLAVMWPVAYIDYKSMRIPNLFPLAGVIYRVVLFPFELFGGGKAAGLQLLSEVIAAVALLVAALLCSLCMKNAIGFGDIKLLGVMGLLLGLEGIWGAVFLSLVVSFVIAAYLLLSKRKTGKDAIPFGPALVIGTFLSVCLSGM